MRARHRDIPSDKPIFGDRDLTIPIHDNVDEIFQESRDNYSWFTDKGRHMGERHAVWKNGVPK